MADLQQQLLALQNDRILRRYMLTEVTTTGRQMGAGSYGSVEEVEVDGLICAGKVIHENLLEAGVESIANKYVRECQLMSKLRHPNVTLFLGLAFLPISSLPLLVMESLEGSLHDLLENTQNIPLSVKRSILDDVASGLVYLHNWMPEPIIHRDLTAKNVLLTSSFVAKITDLGNARIVNLQPGQLARTLSRLPGTLFYMPPEAFDDSSRYGQSLDIFSFGHLCLYAGLQVFPGTLKQPTYQDEDNPDRMLGRTEVERRGDYFEQLENKLPGGEQHPLVRLTKQCLNNTPSMRPTAEQVLTVLREMKEGLYEELVTRSFAMTMAIGKMTSTQDENQAIQQRLEQVERIVEEKDNQLERVQQELILLQRTVEEKDIQLHRVQEEVIQLQQEVEGKNTELNRVQREAEERLSGVHAELQGLQRKVQEKERMYTITEERLSRMREQLQQLNASHKGLRANCLEARIQEKATELNKVQQERDNAVRKLGITQTELTQAQRDAQQKDTQLRDTTEKLDGVQQQLQQLQVSYECLQADLEARIIQLREKEFELEQSEVEKSRLLGELRNCQEQLMQRMEDNVRVKDELLKQKQTQLDNALQQLSGHGSRNAQIPLSERNLPLTINWQQRTMPHKMWGYPHAVTIGRHIFIGGGHARSVKDMRTILRYTVEEDKWKTLLLYDYQYFGMTTINNLLVLVGGCSPTTNKTTNVIAVFDAELGKKRELGYPPLNLSCHFPSVFTYKHFIIIVGGRGDKNDLSRVELLNTSTAQIYQCTQLPWPCWSMTPSVIGDVCYLIGGYIRGEPNKLVLTGNMTELTGIVSKRANTPLWLSPLEEFFPKTAASSCSPWTVTNIPLSHSTGVSIHNSLLTVGGSDDYNLQSSIYLYNHQQWVKMADLPTKRCKCACTVLQNGDLLVAGGDGAEDQIAIGTL